MIKNKLIDNQDTKRTMYTNLWYSDVSFEVYMGNLRKNLRGRRRRQAVKIFRHNPCVFMNMYLLWLHCFFIFWLKFNCLQRVFLSEKIGDSCCTEILIVLNCKTPVNQYSIKYSAPSMIPVACARQLSLNIKDLSRKSPRDNQHWTYGGDRTWPYPNITQVYVPIPTSVSLVTLLCGCYLQI